MKPKEKLIQYLLKCQKQGVPIGKHLIAHIEMAKPEHLKTMKKSIDQAIKILANKRLLNVKDKLIKALFLLQEKGIIKNPSIIAKVETATPDTLKAIKQAIDDSLKACDSKKERIKELLEKQGEGKAKDKLLVIKTELMNDDIFKKIDEILKAPKKKISEPTWGAPKPSPQDIATIPHHHGDLSDYLERLEKHPHLKDWEHKPVAMVHHMREQGVDAEYLGEHTSKHGVIFHDDGTAETTPPHTAHTIRVRDQIFTTPSPEHRKAGGHPRWLPIKHGEASPEMERYLSEQTIRGLTRAVDKKKQTTH